MNSLRMQQTLARSVSFQGAGLFSGELASLNIFPANEGEGIYFVRTDLPRLPIVRVSLDAVVPATRCTFLQEGEASVQTVEHLMAAFAALGITNARVEISGPEVPILDGSSLEFFLKMQKSGVVQQGMAAVELSIQEPLFFSKGEALLIALPSDSFQVSYTLHYPRSSYIKSQFFSMTVSEDLFFKEIAPARTFSLYEDLEILRSQGVLKGGSLENGVVIQGDSVLNPEGVRFPNEMVRHKILDLIGDLFLAGAFFKAHIVAIGSGHAANHSFAKQMLATTLQKT